MTLTHLYSIAEQENIAVFSFQTEESESMSLLHNGKCFIAINPMKLHNEADEKVKLAHEIGHCATCSFYNEFAACDIRAKHERRVDKWAIKKLVPKEELIAAVKDGCTNRYELSEYFELPEDFIQKALDYYFSA